MEKDIEIDGMRMHYDVTGPETGAPVVLMHGWGGVDAAAARGTTVYNLDLPGHGQSDEPPTAWGVDEYTRMVEKFCSLNGIAAPVLIGHSFGAR